MHETTNLTPCGIDLPAGLPELKAFSRSVRPAGQIDAYPSAVDLDDLLQNSEMLQNTKLWRAAMAGWPHTLL
jgi:hypothetical protein